MNDGTWLEVIAGDVADALAAAEGGADRLELVSEPERGGLTPSARTFDAVRAAVDLPVRVMLRAGDGFSIDPEALAGLRRQASELREAGATEFVLGFLDGAGAIDLDAMTALLEAARPAAWTLHHAFDNAAEPEGAWQAVRALPHLDLVLSGGGPHGLGRGLDTLCARAAWQDAGPHWLAGGGLHPDLIPRLLACGIHQFHAGRAARNGGWRRPLDPTAVHRLRAALTPPG